MDKERDTQGEQTVVSQDEVRASACLPQHLENHVAGVLASGTTGTCWLSGMMNLDLQVCPKPYNASLSVLSENFASIISPSKCGHVKILNQIIEVRRTHMVTAYMVIG